MSKELMQPGGVCWEGIRIRNSKLTISDAFFRGMPVWSIMGACLETDGDISGASKLINKNVEKGDDWFIEQEEISQIVEWFSDNPFLMIWKEQEKEL